MLTVRTEVTGRMLIFGERQLRSVLARHEADYNGRTDPTAADNCTRRDPSAL